MPTAALDAKSESPSTTMRVCVLGGASPGLSAGLVAAALADAGAGASGASMLMVRPIVNGPFLSPAFSSIVTLPPDVNAFRSDLDQLRSLVLIKSCTLALGPRSVPASPLTDCASGNAVNSEKSFVIGCGG